MQILNPFMEPLRSAVAGRSSFEGPQLALQGEASCFQPQGPGGASCLLRAKMNYANSDHAERGHQGANAHAAQRPVPPADADADAPAGNLMRTPSRMRFGSGNLPLLSS